MAKKTCPRCKLLLEDIQFNWKIKNERRAVYCKKCSRDYIKSHYNNNKEYYLLKAKKRNNLYRQRCEEYVGQYLLEHPCVDCGECDIRVLEFDHKEKDSKMTEVATMVRGQFAFDTLIEEIKKCEVRCANCHRKKTIKENGSWRAKYAPVA